MQSQKQKCIIYDLPPRSPNNPVDTLYNQDIKFYDWYKVLTLKLRFMYYLNICNQIQFYCSPTHSFVLISLSKVKAVGTMTYWYDFV